MILLLGGTTEGKQVAGYLDEAGLDYLYSTRTAVRFEGKGKYRYGSLDEEGLKVFCRLNAVSLIINACHPFALALHHTVAALADQIPVIRFERVFPERTISTLVHYADNFAGALMRIKDLDCRSMLALTGVQSIPMLSSFWQQYPCWFRILDRQYSIDLATGYGFPATQLLFGLTQDTEEEIELFRRINPQVILTKESGLNGKLDVKIKAALSCGIPIFIIKKPELSPLFHRVHHIDDLINQLKIGNL